MNIEQLNTYLENKEPLDQKAISQIMLLIEKNPYFQIAHMLLLKAMYLTQPEKYNGQLKISASFISDKKKLYQYIHGDIAIKLPVEEKKVTEKTEKVIETKKIESVLENKPIIEEKPIKTIEKIDTELINTSKKIETNQTSSIEKTTDNQNIETIIQQSEKTKVVEELIKRPETKKKVDLPDSEIEKLANQNSEIKHKKIVSDFFNPSTKEITDNQILETDQEEVKAEKNPEQYEKKEFPSKEEIKTILEEKKKNIISKNEPIIVNKEKSTSEEKETIQKSENKQIEKEILPKDKPRYVEKVIESKNEQVEIEKIQKEEPKKTEEKTIPVSKIKESEIKNYSEKTEAPDKTKKDENKIQSGTSDAMSNIFSKIRQIKKEMNIESANTNEPIDLNKTSQKSIIDISTKTDDKKGRGKIIKESFIGFNENEIKKEDLISTEPINIEKSDEPDLEKEEMPDEIKTSGLTAKDLFKQHLKNKENEPEIVISPTVEVNKSPISKIVEKINQPDSEIIIQKKETEKIQIIEKKEEIQEIKITEKKEEKNIENISPSNQQGKLTAAEELLKRIADKKRKMHEEREKEEQEQLLAKEKQSHIHEVKPEEKVETNEIKDNQLQQIEENNTKSEEITSDLNLEKYEPKEKKSQHLIDSFIEKVDSLERLGNKETTLIGDISEKSTEENDDFMTETMADLYIQQKNYQKAIEIYNKLILKFPEKKTYFAIQIKKTESLIK